MTAHHATRSHPQCWTPDGYVHTCADPSGWDCLDCGAPAGTRGGPFYCPPCDAARLDRIDAALDEAAEHFHSQETTP